MITAYLFPQAIQFRASLGGYSYRDPLTGGVYHLTKHQFEIKMAAMQDAGWKFEQ